jgi:Na+-driven multidrug efflux pump
MFRESGYARFELKKSAIRKKPFLDILRLGIPSGIQSSLFSISNSLIQSTVNSFGDTVLAANTAAGGLESFVFIVMQAISATASTAVGQNYGAGNYERIKSCVVRCLICSACFAITVSAVIYLCRVPLLSLYTNNPDAIAIACERMAIILFTYLFFGLMDVISQSMRGMGFSVIPMLIVLFGTCVFRVFWVLVVFPLNPVYISVILSYPVSWILTLIIATVAFLILYKKRKNQALILNKL